MSSSTNAPETASATPSAVLDAALEYAEEGLPVLPIYWPDADAPAGCGCGKSACGSPGKHPLTQNGFKDAATDLDQIREWWRRHPKANVAVALGETDLVVDVDPRNGGERSLVELESKHGPFRTKRVRTGSGGLHIWFTTSIPVRGRTAFLPGIDIKTVGGYVLMPPSLHVQGSYSLENGSGAARAPATLITLIGAAGGHSGTGGLTAQQLEQYAAPGDEEERLRWTRDALDAIRNDQRFDDRSAWVGMAHSVRASCGIGLEEEAFDLFDQWSSTWTTGTYDEEEARRVWDTLPPSINPRGYRWLLELARDGGYELPTHHPDRAENVFQADPTAVALRTGLQIVRSPTPTPLLDQIRQIDTDSPTSVTRMHALLSDLSGLERTMAAASLRYRLEKSFGRSGAQTILEALGRHGERGAFSRDPSGKPFLRVLGADDLDLEVPYLVAGRVPAASVGAVVGDYSVGKSWLMVDLGLSVAFDRSWLGSPVQQSPVVFLVAEGYRSFSTRVMGWLCDHELLDANATPEELFGVLEDRVILNRYPMTFDDREFEVGLSNTVSDSGAGLVIIDTLGKTLGADQPENDNDVANAITGMLSRMAAETGCTTIFTHHTGYEKKRGRGASGWTQGLDFAYLIDGSREAFTAGGSVQLVATKMRDGPWPPDQAFRLKPLPGLSLATPGGDVKTVDTAVVERAEAASTPPSLAARIFSYIKFENPGSTQGELRTAIGGNRGKMKNALAELERQGSIENRGAENRHEYHANSQWHLNHAGKVVDSQEDFVAGPPAMEVD